MDTESRGNLPEDQAEQLLNKRVGTSPKVAPVLESTRSTWAKFSQLFLTSGGIFLLNSVRYWLIFILSTFVLCLKHSFPSSLISSLHIRLKQPSLLILAPVCFSNFWDGPGHPICSQRSW